VQKCSVTPVERQNAAEGTMPASRLAIQYERDVAVKTSGRKLVAWALLIAGIFSLPWLSREPLPPQRPGVGTIGNVQTLLSAYARWKAEYIRTGGDQKMLLPLAYSKGFSVEFTRASGQLTLDLTHNTVCVEVSGLPPEQDFDVWLLSNRPVPAQRLTSQAGDAAFRVGRLQHEQGTATLRSQLGPEVLTDFVLVRVAVTRAAEAPPEGGILFGTPSLFHRLYYSERGDAQGGRGPHPPRHSRMSAAFRTLIPRAAQAKEPEGTPDFRSKMAALIAYGEAIFFHETFNGNGRTCGTCHRAENNFTIDPAFIETLPPDDPLFVAEFNPALADLEQPELLRKNGLIRVNADGFDDLPHKFVMRGVPHLLSLSVSLTSGSTVPPLQRTGWGGDGAPGNGTLREFPIGAIRQHFTKSLHRLEGVDFRLPNEAELDALEAFQLSLGRPTDLSLPLPLKDPLARQGQEIYLDDALGKCNLCHANAGATAAFSHFPLGINENFSTGVENLPHHPARQVYPSMPRDGGFGLTWNGDRLGGFGNGTFNTPPLIEAAATGPFFHNNAVHTIEDVVNFYNSEIFNTSPSGSRVRIELTPTQVLAVAAFLRVLNAQEKIRSAIEMAEVAKQARGVRQEDRALNISRAEIGHAIRVLGAGKLHASAVLHLKSASELLATASRVPSGPGRATLIDLAVQQQNVARQHLVE
jgi:cytochrome c peroxidase